MPLLFGLVVLYLLAKSGAFSGTATVTTPSGQTATGSLQFATGQNGMTTPVNQIAMLAQSTVSLVGATTTAITGSAAAGASVAGIAGAIIGVGILVGEALNNFATCGTIGMAGCTKRSDTDVLMTIVVYVRQLVYGVESGAYTAGQVMPTLQQIYMNGAKYFQNPSRSWYANCSGCDAVINWCSEQTDVPLVPMGSMASQFGCGVPLAPVNWVGMAIDLVPMLQVAA
jgi:hypothetical protein